MSEHEKRSKILLNEAKQEVEKLVEGEE